MTTADLPPPADHPTMGHLKTGVLGTGSLIFMVVAAAAPLTVMAGVAPLAIAVGGIGAPVGYLAAGLVLTVFAVGEAGRAGRITAGARADLTAFVVDPLTAAPDELAEAPIALTIVDGDVAHRPR